MIFTRQKEIPILDARQWNSRSIAMKCIAAKLSLMILIAPIVAFANWQVADPSATVPREPFFQAGVPANTKVATTSYGCRAFPHRSPYVDRPAAIYAISVSGSLKENLERIMDRYHWKVIWKAQYDYNFDGRVTGTSLPNVIERLMKPFPLQATMYMSNRTLLVTSRD